MNSLILDLQKDALDSKHKVSDLLRKAYTVAFKLNVEDMKKWIEYELNGYSKDFQMPPYRRITRCKSCIGTADWLTQKCLEGEYTPLSCSIMHLEYLMSFPSYEIEIEPNVLVESAIIYNAIEAVRNIILEWALKLEKIEVLGRDMTFTIEEENKAREVILQFNTYNNIIIGKCENSQIQQASTKSKQKI